MSLFRRGKVYWVSFTTPDGRRVRQSTGTVDRQKAQELHDQLKAEQWRVLKLGEKPRRSWKEAVVRWLKESSHKASINDSRLALRWLDQHLASYMLDDITRDKIDQITEAKLKEGVSNATVNRTLEVLRAVLRRAWLEWEWIDKVPKVRMLPEAKRRIRWITKEEAEKLISQLPVHLAEMVRFSLATGLRQANVKELEWSQLDLERRVAWIHPDQAKARKAIPVPLNADAVLVLRRQQGMHPVNVFTYRGNPVKEANTKAWKKALKRAGIENFRWHDLRHTWASWHVQQGTPLHVLQELGGWESVEMVKRYAHLNPEHLAQYAEQLSQPRVVQCHTMAQSGHS